MNCPRDFLVMAQRTDDHFTSAVAHKLQSFVENGIQVPLEAYVLSMSLDEYKLPLRPNPPDDVLEETKALRKRLRFGLPMTNYLNGYALQAMGRIIVPGDEESGVDYIAIDRRTHCCIIRRRGWDEYEALNLDQHRADAVMAAAILARAKTPGEYVRLATHLIPGLDDDSSLDEKSALEWVRDILAGDYNTVGKDGHPRLDLGSFLLGELLGGDYGRSSASYHPPVLR